MQHSSSCELLLVVEHGGIPCIWFLVARETLWMSPALGRPSMQFSEDTETQILGAALKLYASGYIPSLATIRQMVDW